MKKGLLAALIIVLVFSGGLACQREPSKIQYKLRLEKGTTYILRVVTNQKISQTVQGQQSYFFKGRPNDFRKYLEVKGA